MTVTTKEIFENYQVRKTKKQKGAFREYLIDFCDRNGYSAKVEKGSFGARNVVVGDVENAKVVYTAHYDTCAVLPFPNFITPKNFTLYLLYQFALVFLFILIGVAVGFLSGLILGLLSASLENPSIADYGIDTLPLVIWVAVMLLLTSGPANRHTANDNTSGVTVLFDIMSALPDTEKGKVAFVFFDLEEAGLVGSSAFYKKHKKQMKQKPLINFDCVSDGENMIFTLKRKARYLKEALEEAFPSTEPVSSEVLTKGVFYPSDQANFRVGVGVAALKKSKHLGILYMNRIHTKRDTVYREENILYLTKGAIDLISLL